MQLLYRINRAGTTVVMATHDREMVDKMRRRVIQLEDGQGRPRRPPRRVRGMRWRFFMSEALNSIRGNAATTLAATVTVLIVTFLMGIFVTTGWWVYHYAVEKRNEVTVKLYLPPDYAASADKRGQVANQVQEAART